MKTDSPSPESGSTQAACVPGMEIVRLGDWMQTFTGVQFWPIDPRASEVNIEDIAHSLANQCRYAGHVSRFYSVAQHSVLVSHAVPQEDAAWGLMHDAAEAYLVDLPRPVKRFSALGDLYRDIEKRLMLVICERFWLRVDEPESVSHADNVLLMTEKRDLMPNSPAKWRETAEPLADAIDPWSPERAKAEFLRRAIELGIVPVHAQPPGDLRAPCRWCAEGNPRVRSSVTEAFVHTDTPIGRRICTSSVQSLAGRRASNHGARAEDRP